MNILVTGAAGFIGSHLCERLLRDKSNHVIGIDAMLGDRTLKASNLERLHTHPRFTFHPANLLTVDLEPLLEGVSAVFHLAGIPGVRSSWGAHFQQYVSGNILATQRLLEACRGRKLKKFIYASTSSVYGGKAGAMSEDARPEPMSPYGVSKLCGEHLCRIYMETEKIPIVILRYFTVYGPRQRPDMAFHRFIRQVLHDRSLTVLGDGRQTRDFTYIDDCVEGTVAALYACDVVGETLNIGGSERASIRTVISLIESLLQKKVTIHFSEASKGEPRHTRAALSKAGRLLNYRPLTPLRAGLEKEINDLKRYYKMDETRTN